MGLDTTHGCWSGPYSAFCRWRKAVAKAADIDLDKMEGFGGDGDWMHYMQDAVSILLNHSDCDGSIAAWQCGPLADRLEELLPLLAENDRAEREYSERGRAEQFIKGLREAASNGESVEFH